MEKLIVGVNDLATTHPQLAKEWHPTKNGDLKSSDVMAGSRKKVWWLFPYDDPITEKHFDFEWQTTISNRTHGKGCPYLSGNSIWIGFNDLATTNPELVKEWHPTKNGNIKPTDVTVGSKIKVWWLYSYDDPKTGRHFDFEWLASIANRVKGRGCPYLVGKAIYIGFNDLATTHPQLAKEWHPTKNGNVKPIDVSAGSNKKVWWLYTYDDPKTGKNFDFEWLARINHRANGSECPLIISSKMERLTYDILKKMKLNFKVEKKFLKCKNKKSLPFDVYLSDKNKIIELDGVQHFRGIDAWGGDNQLAINKKHDEIKDNFCLENNIPLLRIPFIYDVDNDKEEIEDIINNFIEYGVVPDKIKDFYEEEGRTTYITLLEKISN